MKKYGKLSIAGMLIATIAASSAISPAYAGKKERRIAAGIAIGAIAGAIIVNEVGKKRDRRYKRRHRDRAYYRKHRRIQKHRYRQHQHQRFYDRYDEPVFDNRYDQPRVVYRQPQPQLRYQGRISAAQAHTSWCQNRYRSYRTYDNTFQPYHGPRRQCHSPYN